MTGPSNADILAAQARVEAREAKAVAKFREAVNDALASGLGAVQLVGILKDEAGIR